MSRHGAATPMRRALAAAAVVLSLTLAAACSAEEPAASSASTAPTTAQVERDDLTRTSTEIGTIGYGASADLVNGLAGTLTAVTAVGTVIENGDELYRVDDVPVLRLRGALPAWRDLTPGMDEGTDVEQLEQALFELGYAEGLDLTVDGTWTSYTTVAVKRWQKAAGLSQTGTIPLGRVVFTPADVRIAEQVGEVGGPAAPGSPVIAVSSTTRAVQVALQAKQAALAPVGAEVGLALPGGGTATGTVTAVAATAPAQEGDESGLAITVESDAEALADLLDGTTLRVRFVTVLAQDVLIVPVDALVALSGGGYAVEVLRDGVTEQVRVEPGRYSGTRVEIVGGELAAGDEVVTTR